MSVAAGIKGKTVAAHPKEAVLFELQNGQISYAELEKKIGIDSKELRKILTELDREGVINVNKTDL
jgi:DNA-binding Lrp family transcriptional regulator